MEDPYIRLVIIELLLVIILITVGIIKYIFYILNKRKIKSILDFFDKRMNKEDSKDKYEECLKIIEMNREDKKNGK